jgi:hypothetical protein
VEGFVNDDLTPLRMQAVSPDNRVTGAICQYSASNLVIDKHDPTPWSELKKTIPSRSKARLTSSRVLS